MPGHLRHPAAPRSGQTPSSSPNGWKDRESAPSVQSSSFRVLEAAGVPGVHSGNGGDPGTIESETAAPLPQNTSSNSQEMKSGKLGVFDLETQRSAQEVGGWHRADLMKISCLVLYDSQEQVYHEYLEKDVPRFIERLRQYDCVVGFNIKRFDYKVLSAYSDIDFQALPTLDLLEEIHSQLGYRLSLDHLAKVTLGSKKSADGLQALRWWKQGKIREIIDYCRQDVRITWDIYRYGRENSYLLFQNKAGHTVRVPVHW
ncbi:MAG: ribonuclease H-like domain-containing protein [Deltaproteobacteria bacterium]|nr:ribonuclease H-like domain-containing protein [Deltaproteobacteria bacterium]